MKPRQFFYSLAAVALAVSTASAQMPPVVGAEEKPPEVKLPTEKPVNVAQYDGVRAASAHNWQVVQSKGPEAWAKNPAAKGKTIRVAVLDTGAQVDHPALRASIKATYNAISKTRDVTDGHGHGTHCADTVRQLLPDCDLVIVKVLTDNGAGRADVIAHGIDWAVTEGRADVLSLSLGGSRSDRWQEEAVRRALAAGVIVVAASGNEGPGDTEGYPARLPGVVSVAAADRNNRLAGFSSHGPNVLTVKYGVDIRAALPGDQEGDMSGTSMACPSEAACAGMWVATHPEVSRKDRPAEYRKAVVAASPFKERTNARGYGLYTADRIVGSGGGIPPAPGKPTSVTITFADLSPAKQAELRAGGVTKFRLEVGHDGTAPATIPPAVVPVQAAPVHPVYQPVLPAYQPAPLPQWVPGPCPGGVCPQPAPRWVPGQVIRSWMR